MGEAEKAATGCIPARAPRLSLTHTDLRDPEKAFIFPGMSYSTQAIAALTLPLLSSALLAGLLLRASAK